MARARERRDHLEVEAAARARDGHRDRNGVRCHHEGVRVALDAAAALGAHLVLLAHEERPRPAQHRLGHLVRVPAAHLHLERAVPQRVPHARRRAHECRVGVRRASPRLLDAHRQRHVGGGALDHEQHRLQARRRRGGRLLGRRGSRRARPVGRRCRNDEVDRGLLDLRRARRLERVRLAHVQPHLAVERRAALAVGGAREHDRAEPPVAHAQRDARWQREWRRPVLGAHVGRAQLDAHARHL